LPGAQPSTSQGGSRRIHPGELGSDLEAGGRGRCIKQQHLGADGDAHVVPRKGCSFPFAPRQLGWHAGLLPCHGSARYAAPKLVPLPASSLLPLCITSRARGPFRALGRSAPRAGVGLLVLRRGVMLGGGLRQSLGLGEVPPAPPAPKPLWTLWI